MLKSPMRGIEVEGLAAAGEKTGGLVDGASDEDDPLGRNTLAPRTRPCFCFAAKRHGKRGVRIDLFNSNGKQ